MVDYSNISNEPDVNFVERLIKEKGLASIPISVFNHNNVDRQQIRFCFAKKKDTLDKAAEIINAI